MYYLGYSDNFLGAEPRLWLCGLLLGLIGGQMGLLYLQSYRKFTWLFCSRSGEGFNYQALPSGFPDAEVIYI